MKNIRMPTVVGLIKAENVMPQVTSADAGKLATVDSNGKWAAAELEVGQGEVAVDTTLLVSGAAADAKVTGDKITDLKSAIGDIKGTPIASNAVLAVGGISGSDGADVSRNDRMRSIYYRVSDYGGIVNMPTGVKCIPHGYDADFVWVSAYPSATWQDSFTWENFPNTFIYVRFVIDTGSISDNIVLHSRILSNEEITEIIKTNESQGTKVEPPYDNGSKNQVARLGWNVYATYTPPEESIASYKLAYKNGCRIMLADVQPTADNNFVCFHDLKLGYADMDETLPTNTVKNLDGTNLTTAEKQQVVTSLTLAELNQYDYGIYKGPEYAGMKIPMLNSFLEWCGLMNCIPFLEIKAQLTTEQVVAISNMVKMYGLGERVIINEYNIYLANTLSTWVANLPGATIGIIGGSAIDALTTKINTIISAGMKALVTLSGASQLSAIQDGNGDIDYTKVKSITDLGADFVYTEIKSASELSNFYNGGYLSVFRYIISSYLNINDWIHANV